MRDAIDAGSKVYYRPMEAAIRWADLLVHESSIFQSLVHDETTTALFVQWPHLKLNIDRIHDALINGELPFGRDGINDTDPLHLDQPDLTIRHVDLRFWMAKFYPGEKPHFLFDALERNLHSAISLESTYALMMERDTLKACLSDCERELEKLRQSHAGAQGNGHPNHDQEHQHRLHPRSESTYLKIVGGLLSLLLGRSPGGKPYSSFESMNSVIDALLAHYEGTPGMSERTLWAKLAEARRHLEGAASR